jgi:hypothetical protein
MRRTLRALMIAVLMAVTVPPVMSKAMDIIVPSICEHLEPGGFWWDFWGCGKPSAGGGGGGAG